MDINIDEIIAEFGEHYIVGGQGRKDLQTVMMERSQYLQSFPLLPTESTVVHKATSSIKRVLQAFQKAFTPIVGQEVLFELEKIELDHVKIDELIDPDDIMPSWLGFLASNNLDRSEWPIVRYIIEELIVKKYYEDLEMTESFKGVKAPIVPGTASAAGTSMNGFRHRLRTAYDAGKTNSIVMGAVPTGAVDFVNYIEEFVNELPELIRGNVVEISLSRKLERRYREGVRTKYNQNYEQKPNLVNLIDDPSIFVRGYASMDNSDLIYTTPQFNKANPMKAGKNQGIFDMQKVDRSVKLLSDWWVGVGCWYWPYMYHNDQDLA